MPRTVLSVGVPRTVLLVGVRGGTEPEAKAPNPSGTLGVVTGLRTHETDRISTFDELEFVGLRKRFVPPSARPRQ
ncbi:hypothetical protein GCM10008995_09450 [Halobellus salinus]|uniref:Uncharacterized protein n=1 Tax=Halobellus salinus TaxID=931585 RepID=A0A830EL71_9EURY|nr:hypothetical protein [Halobellus salinus]GGJ01767.1 hypothetical protein GCM10008995_09450 [Halobellus salinus]SMP18242.1 hypothetical protein SAMN06265347_106135 [Halobellus salinus]